MRVDSSKPFVLVYSLHPDSEMGAIIEPYVVQLNDNGTLSLSYQKVYPTTTETYISAIDRTDQAIIGLCAEFTPEVITKKFSKKEIKPQEFFTRYVDEKMLKEVIRPYVEERLNRIVELLRDKPLYLRGKSGNPAQVKLTLSEDEITAHFHFNKNEEGTKYYPTFRHRGEKLILLNKNVCLLTYQPCRILLDEIVYSFEEKLDGKKLVPFFTKWNIQIPKSSEAQYYKKFIKPLIENHPVIAHGFQVIEINKDPIPILRFEMAWNNQPALQLLMDYGMEKIPLNDPKQNHVRLEQSGDDYTYYKIMRRPELESRFLATLKNQGLVKTEGSYFRPFELEGPALLPSAIIEWVAKNRLELENEGFRISQDVSTQKFFLGEARLDLKVEEKNDWFDVYAMVYFGDFKVPLLSLRKYLLNDIREFPLPDGKIAILPESWFTKYKDMLLLAGDQSNEHLKFRKHHFNLIDNLFENGGAQITGVTNLKEAIEKFRTSEIVLPKNFETILRPYQKEGFRWMNFLRENNFGGCLADDMGLGKTVQALALLESSHHNQINEVQPEDQGGQLSIFGASGGSSPEEKSFLKYPSLIVMPTSLVHNWEFEVKKFAPALKVITYTGLERADKLKSFKHADIVLSTYGTIRNDIEIVKDQHFNYVILDESQVVKNPHSKVSLAVKRLQARHRLSLTGTPIENSLSDLWSQMSFLNPGMLGSFQTFKDEFVVPIEKKNDHERKLRLRSLIQPFILRRTKEEVATELPTLTEKIYFSQMSPEQKQVYDDTRNYYRKRILENIEKMGESKSQFFILKGLMQLRLIANHPRMQDATFEGESGKFQDIISTLEEVIGSGHKVLVFSQFVRHLELIRSYLTKNAISYSLLTGETVRRSEAIAKFRENENVKVFLISLKAGGVGLNLTEAEYVFLCDPWWNPASEKQAINRAHRIGQDKKVFSYKFISVDTVEEKILQLQERKLRLSADFIQPELSATHLISRAEVEELFS